MKSQRQLQVGETIKRTIADIFLREGISSISGNYITILEADVSPDIKNARIFIDIFGDEKSEEKIVKKLNESAPRFRFQLAKKITTRLVPEILFVLDKTQCRANKINSLIEKEAENFHAEVKKKTQKK